MSSRSKTTGRRILRFQLTSLLDLLLIIVFAQYLEFHVFQQETERKAAERVGELQTEAEKRIDAAKMQFDSAKASLNEQIRSLERQQDVANFQSVLSSTQLETTTQLIRSLFSQLELDAPPIEANNASPEQDISQLAENIASLQDVDLIRFLAGYDELRKRAEVWTIHVSKTGRVNVQAGSTTNGIRIEGSTQVSREESFVSQARLMLLQLPQPKDMVIILVSFSPRAVAGNFQPVVDGLPELVSKLESDFQSKVRFEFSVIGALDDPEPNSP